ncbi:MAG: FtsQ-type POTRA domain-containing protein [Syntrophorhabdaceae bacterium]|nr:FtsQ-type POTRA domain-containing protein [Syntrophorhabdaceae bacterium]
MKRILYILFLAPLCLLSFLTMVYLSTNKGPLFMIKDIKIKGIKQLEEGEVIKRISPFIKETIFSLDAQRIKESITAHPFVRDVSVKTVFPFSVVIEVKEKKPSALWIDEKGNVMVIDENGEPFRILGEGMAKDMFVINTKEKTDMKWIFEEINRWIKDGIIKKEQISEIVFAGGNMTLYFAQDGIEVILGKEDQKKRLKRALMVLEDAKKRGLLIRCIDARFEKGAIIQERQV